MKKFRRFLVDFLKDLRKITSQIKESSEKEVIEEEEEEANILKKLAQEKNKQEKEENSVTTADQTIPSKLPETKSIKDKD